ncbi:CoB--CoM heterodisulfide reductase iron-sulfur subunit B family protein [Desulfovibrio legallii]|uniref:Heterodisulfide reductase subunit B n=1 Tax=Desulfovibrio legallii TaxID=571438 RepID=A0A6H3FCA3_9BACT|nr:CoB--CoM heterodisulfide reductase iron-sulfur subunit B family protein [Desulfovibrio legallii]RHH18726.1 heterodisulfide reductase subunit B [Desulfovibrio sp. AM18-2]TBH78473.1 heterodisulfide reductase subunit B [Desulfovibrio legallii]CAI3237967.1 Heterodisulfide reductase subunit B-like protein [Desulfovibrio diazotrophicus]
MNFAYYPGCSARGSSADYEKSTQAVCKALNMNLVDIPDWSCCGSTPAHAVSSELSAALCVRNLDIAAQQQADLLLTPCPSCLSNLRMASKRMEDPQFRARVDELLDGPAAEKFPPVTSVMQGIAGQLDMDAIASRVRKSLKGLKLAAYYGCLMSRPAEIMDFGDPENPTLMESMLAACGAEMVDFPLKTSCCGASFGIPERSMTARNTGRILDLATRLGVDAVIVACPLCQMNLDLRQVQAGDAVQTRFNLPILYYTQMLGLAFDLPKTDLGLEKLRVSADGLIAKLEELRRADAAEGGRS